MTTLWWFRREYFVCRSYSMQRLSGRTQNVKWWSNTFSAGFFADVLDGRTFEISGTSVWLDGVTFRGCIWKGRCRPFPPALRLDCTALDATDGRWAHRN